MRKSAWKYFFVASIAVVSMIIESCGSDSDSSNNPNPPAGKVLLATVASDSVRTSAGVSTKISSVSGQTLNFTDRDSVEISLNYAGTSNNSSLPMKLYYSIDTTDYVVYQPSGLILDDAEHSVTVTIPSPKVNQYFYYQIRAATTGGSCYFRFRDLNIYKK